MKHLKTLITLFLLLIGTGMSWAEFKDFELDFTKDWAKAISTGGSASSLYITSVTDGVATLSGTETEGYLAHFYGYYHSSSYGVYFGVKLRVPVKAGKYRIDLGTNDYGGKVVVTDGSSALTTINTMSSNKFAENHANIVSGEASVTSDCVIEIYANGNEDNNNVYFPYIAVTKVAETELVEETGFQNFSLRFIDSWAAGNINPNGSASSYYVTAIDNGNPTLATTKPANYLAYFLGYYKDATYGLYYNAEIEVPVKAGKYEISLGMSDYGGDIAVFDGTKELTSINTIGGKYAANNNNVATDIVAVESDCILKIYAKTNATNVYFPYIGVKKVVEATPHVHSFSGLWEQTETHHYHKCTADGCNITDYSAVPADLEDYVKYGAHNYIAIITLPSYYTCTVCGYENKALKADADAVNAVVALIEAIGEVENSEACKARIDAARKAYDLLSEERQDLVVNYEDLTAAEALLKALTPMDVAEREAIWDWENAKDGDQIVKESFIVHSIGEIHSDIAGLSLEVDATPTSNSYFKATPSGKVFYGALSAGSTIKVPVRRPGDKVYITCPAGQTSYTVGNVDGKNYDVNKGYTATQADAANGYVLITATGKGNRFYRIRVVQKWFRDALPMITLNSAGWASFTSLLRGYVVACPLGAKAYVATSVDDETVTLEEVKHFTYGEGVFIKGEPYAELFANVVDATSSYPQDNNLTVGCSSDIMLYPESKAYIVATNLDTYEGGFYCVKTAINVPAGKAYLYAPNANAKSLKITFANGEEATGIESVVAGAEDKAATVFYNLAGQAVGKDYKGIVVGNDGKKYVK